MSPTFFDCQLQGPVTLKPMDQNELLITFKGSQAVVPIKILVDMGVTDITSRCLFPLEEFR